MILEQKDLKERFDSGCFSGDIFFFRTVTKRITKKDEKSSQKEMNIFMHYNACQSTCGLSDLIAGGIVMENKREDRVLILLEASLTLILQSQLLYCYFLRFIDMNTYCCSA